MVLNTKWQISIPSDLRPLYPVRANQVKRCGRVNRQKTDFRYTCFSQSLQPVQERQKKCNYDFDFPHSLALSGRIRCGELHRFPRIPFFPAMFGTFSVIRFSQSAAVLLTAGLAAFAGCKCMSPQSSTVPITPPVSVPQFSPQIPPPKMDESDQYSAFRPIMPELFTPPMPVLEPQTRQLTTSETNSEGITMPQNAALSKIDELNRKIAELEKQLEEARQAPPPAAVDNLLVSDMPIESMPEVRPVRSLPIINKQGVNVYADESQRVRIEVSDKVLFMPNSWQLTTEGEETLRVIAAELRASYGKSVLDIEGHTDSLMGDPNNPMQKHEISNVKTKVVMDFFVNALRWDTARIGTSSFGRSRPIADNGTPEGRARNNRIEIVIRDGEE